MSKEIILFAHNIRSLWNIGSFFRTADAFGVSRVLLSGYTSTPPRSEISKTALGAEEWIPWEKVEDSLARLGTLKEQGYTIVALELTPESQHLPAFSVSTPVCLIVGHEILGVPQEFINIADAVVSIPMSGTKHSLNVSVAVGIALYHLSHICP